MHELQTIARTVILICNTDIHACQTSGMISWTQGTQSWCCMDSGHWFGHTSAHVETSQTRGDRFQPDQTTAKQISGALKLHDRCCTQNRQSSSTEVHKNCFETTHPFGTTHLFLCKIVHGERVEHGWGKSNHTWGHEVWVTSEQAIYKPGRSAQDGDGKWDRVQILCAKCGEEQGSNHAGSQRLHATATSWQVNAKYFDKSAHNWNYFLNSRLTGVVLLFLFNSDQHSVQVTLADYCYYSWNQLKVCIFQSGCVRCVFIWHTQPAIDPDLSVSHALFSQLGGQVLSDSLGWCLPQDN